MAAPPTVAVIGGGFSGVLTALHLLADPAGPIVRLIERGPFARGAAFSTANPHHLLNVRVANMSAYPDDPDHFTRWLAEHSGWSVQSGFVTRGVYGDYLQDLLRRAILEGPAGRLLLEADEAVDIEPTVDGWRIRLALGRSFRTTVEVDSGQPVVSTGPYRWIRHPSYLGLLLIMAGFGLALGGWLSLVAAVVLPLPALAWRMHVEEAELIRVLGEPYRAYRAHTARLVPRVW